MRTSKIKTERPAVPEILTDHFKINSSVLTDIAHKVFITVHNCKCRRSLLSIMKSNGSSSLEERKEEQ